MKLPPLTIGAVAGLVLMFALAPATGNALGELAKARGERDRLAAIAGGPQRPSAPLVAPGLAAGDDAALLATRIRGRAHDAGVLVEELKVARGGGALLRVELGFSGSEKAVVALADAIERDAVLVRFARWRIEPIAGGGVRLSGQAVAVRR